MPSATMECSSVVAAPGGWPCAYARTRRRHEHGIPWDPSGGVKEKSFPAPSPAEYVCRNSLPAHVFGTRSSAG